MVYSEKMDTIKDPSKLDNAVELCSVFEAWLKRYFVQDFNSDSRSLLSLYYDLNDTEDIAFVQSARSACTLHFRIVSLMQE